MNFRGAVEPFLGLLIAILVVNLHRYSAIVLVFSAIAIGAALTIAAIAIGAVLDKVLDKVLRVIRGNK